jgi:hypothetical protein
VKEVGIVMDVGLPRKDILFVVELAVMKVVSGE